MSQGKLQEHPNKLRAFTYVVIQAVILLALIFLDNEYGFRIMKFPVSGTLLTWLGLVGIVFSAISIRSSLTAMPLPKTHGQLATNGLYTFVRHPMYTSVLMFAAGTALSSGLGYKYLLVVALVVLFYYKSIYEERYLRQKYPGYADYASRTPRFIPKLPSRT